MSNKKITTDDVASALIDLSENIGLCDKDTATGFRISKKKDILKSGKASSFPKFINEIQKRQAKKNQKEINNDNQRS